MSAETVESVQDRSESDVPQQIEKGSKSNSKCEVAESVEISLILPSVEAMLVSSDRPLKPVALVDALVAHFDSPINASLVERATELLNEQYDAQSRAFRIEKISGGYPLDYCLPPTDYAC